MKGEIFTVTLKYHVDTGDHLISITATGENTERDWVDLFLAIKGDLLRREGMDFIFDLRENQTTVSDDYLWTLSRRLVPMISMKKSVKWVFVTLKETAREKLGRFTRHLSLVRNLEIRIFADPDSGLSWIGEDRELRHGGKTA